MLERSKGEEGKVGTKASETSDMITQVSLRRLGLAHEQANLLSFLLSDESTYMNGSIVVNDGGFHDIR